MIVVDLAKEYDNYLGLWQDVLTRIASGNDQLRSNYLDLDPRSFLSFPVLIKDDMIICFSGLQSNQDKWGTCARINARMWISPEYRHDYLMKMTSGDKFVNTKYLLPVQLEIAKQSGIDTVFISREGDYRRFLERYCDLILQNTGHKFTVLPDRYNVCGNIVPAPRSCSQLIAVYSVSGTMTEWNSNMAEHRLDLA